MTLPPSARDEEASAFTRSGRTVRFDASRHPKFWRRVVDGAWEPSSFDAVATLTGPETHFIDIGAWIGPLTLFAAAGGSRVTAVEPDPKALEALRANLALNAFPDDRVEVVAAAVTPDGAATRLGFSPKSGGGDSLSSLLRFQDGPGFNVAGVSPEALLAKTTPNERVILKIDIEGGEYLIGEALAPLLTRADAVIVSWHRRFARGDRRGVARIARWFWTARRTTRLVDAAGPRRIRRIGGRRRFGAETLARLSRSMSGPLWPLRGDWLLLAPGGPSDRAFAAVRT